MPFQCYKIGTSFEKDCKVQSIKYRVQSTTAINWLGYLILKYLVLNFNTFNMRKVFTRLGQRIKMMRETREISQAELAAHVDCDKRTIVRIEQGEPSTTSTIEKVAKALEVDGEILVNASEDRFLELLSRISDRKKSRNFDK